MVRRPALLALLALSVGIGCNAGNPSGQVRKEPALTKKETLSKIRIIANHNKNATAIQSLKATPAIEVAADGRHYGLKGRMAMERPKDFRLEISSTAQKQADIGSNEKEFWFWVRDSKDKYIYVCDHDKVNASPLASTMQPDWILEAMGFREITDREAATISATPGDKPGQIVFRQLRRDPKGDTLTKMTIINEETGEIIEHRLYAGAEKELLARATISQYTHVKLPSTGDEASSSEVVIPSKFKLDWIVEKFSLDITMGRDLQVNPEFPKEQRTALFTEPPIAGVTRKDLALVGGSAPAPTSRIYESMPRSSVRLGKPQALPMNVEGNVRSTARPTSKPSDLGTFPPESTELVGPLVPTGRDPEAVQASNGRLLPRPDYEQ